MPDWGEQYVAQAEKYLDVVERPKGSNSGGPIDEWNREAGYSFPVPWCGTFVLAMARDIGWENMESVCHGYTGYIYDRAKEKGWLRKGGASTPAGSLFLIAGKHVGIVRASNATTLLTLEGNANDGVRSYTRAWNDGWVAVVPPDIGKSSARKVYGFEDLGLKPKVFGGWKDQATRDRQLARAKANPALAGWWFRPVRINTKAPYAFEAGPAGTWGAEWNYGPWSSKKVRDEQLAAWKSSSPGAKARTYAKTIQSGGWSGGPAVSIGKVD